MAFLAILLTIFSSDRKKWMLKLFQKKIYCSILLRNSKEIMSEFKVANEKKTIKQSHCQKDTQQYLVQLVEYLRHL